MKTEKRTDLRKISFGFTPEDMRVIQELQAKWEPEMGPVTYIVAIRRALRLALAGK